jgi:large subunit ribosomal protein L32
MQRVTAIVKETTMAVPKRKKSRSRTRRRRAQWKAAPVSLVPIFLGGREYLVPRAWFPPTGAA